LPRFNWLLTRAALHASGYDPVSNVDATSYRVMARAPGRASAFVRLGCAAFEI
jgi:hypothetical protein